MPGGVAQFTALVEAEPTIEADAAAREAFAATGTPDGVLQDPTITIHTKADPLVIAQNETVFAEKVAAAEDRTADLVQLYTVAPATYPATPGAPYGAGHCNFTSDTQLALVELMDNWVRNGVFPGANAVAEAMGTESGYNAAYQPGPWPIDAL